MKNGLSPRANAVIALYAGLMAYAAAELMLTYKTQDKEQVERAKRWWNAIMNEDCFEAVLSLAFELDDYERQLLEQQNKSPQAAR